MNPYSYSQPPMPYGQQGFIPNGVQPTGYPATPAVSSGYPNPMGTLAAMSLASQLSNGFSGGSSSSFSSSSSDVSIVKYDDHFRKDSKTWCLDNLVDLDGGPAMTADEIKANPPLGLKFKGCDLVIPIPNAKAMCATSKEVLKNIMGGAEYMKATDKEKTEAAKELSKALLVQYVEGCGYGTAALNSDKCATSNLPMASDDYTEQEARAFKTNRKEARRQQQTFGGVSPYSTRTIRDILGAYTT